MRHRVKGRKLSRKKAHRTQTLRDLSNALIREHRIVTTLAKAKALRPFFEPLVTRAKEDTQHNRRQVFGKLNNKHTVSKLFDEIGPKAQGRPGGYTRIIKYGYRKGDGAEMAIIELVDYNDIKPEQEQKKQKKTRRAGRKKKTTSAQPQQQDKTDEEQTAEEEQSAQTEVEEVTESKEEADTSQEEESAGSDELADATAQEEKEVSKEEKTSSSDQAASEDESEADNNTSEEEDESDEDKK